jgi:ketosteroid isomerase-like protein
MNPMNRFRIIALLTLAICVSGCTPPAFDIAAESAKVAQRDADWSRVSFDGKDIESIVSYWTDDAHLMQPGLPPIDGKTAIRAFVTASLKIPGFKIHWVSEKPVFSPDGKMAYLMSSVETTAPGANGALETTHGRSVTIWTPGAGGQWRCVIDISNDAPAT